MKLTTDQKIALREMLKAVLSTGTSTVVFEKADSTIRAMKATRDKEIIGATVFESYVNPVKPRAESAEMLPCFDVESQAWRGFSFERIISVNGVKVEHLVKLVG